MNEINSFNNIYCLNIRIINIQFTSTPIQSRLISSLINIKMHINRIDKNVITLDASHFTQLKQ